MTQAIARARIHVAQLQLADTARALIVCGCGLALVLAGPALPF
ncbi:hypothetical protein [Erythrobacter mangrovi]|nr:hypothetical protein [Erythrobacter mangrovi]